MRLPVAAVLPVGRAAAVVAVVQGAPVVGWPPSAGTVQVRSASCPA